MNTQYPLHPNLRLAMMNDLTGYGHCSTAVSLPVISTLGVQVCPIPTAILSNHFAFPFYYYEDYSSHIREYLHAWKELQLSFHGFYCGFLGSVEQVAVVEEFLDIFNPPFFLLDPVMGDHGKLYSSVSEAHCPKMKELISRANLITPNLTEACLLTDTPYREYGWTDYELEALCRKLHHLCPGAIVITGIRYSDCLMNYIWQEGRRTAYSVPVSGRSRPGTGDIFASILAADTLLNIPLELSVKKAADFTALCIQGAEELGIPVPEGVPLEQYLPVLYQTSCTFRS